MSKMTVTEGGGGSGGGGSLLENAAAILSALTSSTLGYTLLENPEGFILAVLFDWFVGFIQSVANNIAAEFVAVVGMFNDAVIGGIGYALGTPGRVYASLIRTITVEMTRLAADLGASMGPFGFLAIPVVWATSFLLLIGLGVLTWRGYKWLRTVFL